MSLPYKVNFKAMPLRSYGPDLKSEATFSLERHLGYNFDSRSFSSKVDGYPAIYVQRKHQIANFCGICGILGIQDGIHQLHLCMEIPRRRRGIDPENFVKIGS